MSTRFTRRFSALVVGLVMVCMGAFTALPQAHAADTDPLFHFTVPQFNGDGTATFSGTATPGQFIMIQIPSVMSEEYYLGATITASDNSWSVTVKYDGVARYQIVDTGPEDACKKNGGTYRYRQYDGSDIGASNSGFWPQPAGSDIDRNAVCAAAVPTADAGDVKVGKTLIANDTIWPYIDWDKRWYFTVTKSACSENGCVAQADIPNISPQQVAVTSSGVNALSPSSMLPDVSTAYSKPGVYAWTVEEAGVAGLLPGVKTWNDTFKKSSAKYYVRASVKETSSGFIYNWVTITQLKNDKGEDVNTTNPDVGVKVGEMKFVNIAETVGELKVKKVVENKSGRQEEGPYEMKAVFDWPANFNGVASGDKWTETVPAVKIDAGQTGVTNASCTPNQPSAGKTQCTFTLDKGATVKISDIPVGADYTVEETSTGNYETTIANDTGKVPMPTFQAVPQGTQVYLPTMPDLSGATSEADCDVNSAYAQGLPLTYAPHTWDYDNGRWEWESSTQECVFKSDPIDHTANKDIQILVTVTNTYKDITPTGLALEYLPYVLMVVIPLGAIGAYVAMRRKLLS